MPKNSFEYDKKYYEEVTKPKRQKKALENKQMLQEHYEAGTKVIRKCPKCGIMWEETLKKPPARAIKLEKQCPQCALKVKLEYQKKPEVRSKINARLRERYANSEELRHRRAKHTAKWRNKQTTESED